MLMVDTYFKGTQLSIFCNFRKCRCWQIFRKVMVIAIFHRYIAVYHFLGEDIYCSVDFYWHVEIPVPQLILSASQSIEMS